MDKNTKLLIGAGVGACAVGLAAYLYYQSSSGPGDEGGTEDQDFYTSPVETKKPEKKAESPGTHLATKTFRSASAAFKAGNLDIAVDSFTEVLSHKHQRTASAAFKAGNLDIAVDSFTESIKHDPKNFKVFTNRALTYLKQKKYQEAYEDGMASVAIQPSYKGYYAAGKGAMGLKRYDEAIGFFEQATTFEKADKKACDASMEICRTQLAKQKKRREAKLTQASQVAALAVSTKSESPVPTRGQNPTPAPTPRGSIIESNFSPRGEMASSLPHIFETPTKSSQPTISASATLPTSSSSPTPIASTAADTQAPGNSLAQTSEAKTQVQEEDEKEGEDGLHGSTISEVSASTVLVEVPEGPHSESEGESSETRPGGDSGVLVEHENKIFT